MAPYNLGRMHVISCTIVPIFSRSRNAILLTIVLHFAGEYAARASLLPGFVRQIKCNTPLVAVTMRSAATKGELMPRINSQLFRVKRHWWRLISVALIIALTAPMLGSPAMRGQSEAPLDVPYGPVLFLVTAAGEAPPVDLPPTTTVHARLAEQEQVWWVASGAVSDPDAIAAAGLPVQTLDADTTGDVYYLADATAPDAASLAATAGTVLWSGSNHLIVATTVDGELGLVETLPAQGVALTLIAPLPLAPPGAVDAAAVFPEPAAAPDPAITALLAQITTAELQDLVTKLSGQVPVTVGGTQVTLNTRYTFAGRIRDAEQFVYEYYQQLSIPVQYANWTYGNYSGRNVVAEVRGTTQPERVFIVGGHLDSISNVPYSSAPGADDNATGTAATMVLARLLRDYQPAMTVRFVHFTAEEQGHWGSKVYAASLRQRGEQVAGYFDLDMIGWDGNGDRVVEIHTAYGPKSNALADQYLERNTRYGIGLTFERKTGSASRFSDHSSFWDNDYASFLIIENFFNDTLASDRNPYYHNTGDLPSRVNFDYVARIARVTMAALVELAGYNIGSPPATPTPTATPPPTATPAPTPTPNPDVCTELLVNGDFESSGNWQFGSTPFPGRYTTVAAFTGAQSVQLGIPDGNSNRRAYSTVFQRVTIPADAEAPVLLRYAERPHGAADNADYRQVLLLNSSYGYVAQLSRSYAAGSGAWTERVFDVTAYRGRSLVVYFNVYNNGTGTQLWSYIDRVELGTCVKAAGPEEPIVTPEPTVTSPVTPTLVLEPAALQLGSLFGGDQVTMTVRLGEHRNGFTWQANSEATWLQLERLSGVDDEALVVKALADGLTDGVYTTTVRVAADILPDAAIEVPALYVVGEISHLYLPTILTEDQVD